MSLSRPLLSVVPPLAFTVLLVSSCSKPASEQAASATGPTPVVSISTPDGGGVSHTTVVNFPPRSEPIDFRNQLESKYANQLRRPLQQVYVDTDGEATWVGEYDRYRVNGCDHATATQRALSQVDGAAPGPICSVLAFPENAQYPPRDHVVDFRRQLGAKYQGMGRSAQSAVDPDGAAIWLAEYFRYRTSGCDHNTAVQNTLTQVDGNPAPPTCAVACAYNIPSAIVAGIGGTFTATAYRTSGTCEWIAGSEADWIVVNRPITGGDRGALTYTVAPNTGGQRQGRIRVAYPGGTSYHDITQNSQAYSLQFQMIDPGQSTTTPVTECRIRSTATTCTLAALTSLLPPGVTSYDWRVEYAYNGTKVKTQTGALSNFAFAETCGPAPAEGSLIPMTVRLTASDGTGLSATATSGQGMQPSLFLRVFSCP
jgi:hypothetical protein